MKRVSKITLESMRKELAVLETDKLEKIRGGYLNTDWSCAFDCLEYINKQQGCNNRDAQSYYREYMNTLSYGGSAYDPKERGGVDENFYRGFTSSDSPQFGRYPSVKDGGLDRIYDAMDNHNFGDKSNSTLIAIESENRKDVGHFVVGKEATKVVDENGKTVDLVIIYEDPNGSSGTINASQVKGFWNVRMNCDTGNLDDTGNMY